MIKITNSTGVGSGTKVVDLDSGLEIKGVESLKLSIDGHDEIVKAELRLLFIETEIEAHPKFLFTDPKSGEFKEVSKIVFADGSVFEP